MQRIGCLGPEGSFSEEAVHCFLAGDAEFKRNPPQVCIYTTIPQLLRACDQKAIDWAFVPVENSIEGQVGATLDTLIQSEELLIYREFKHHIKQCLLTAHPLELSQIATVYSHEQGLGQCREFIEQNLGSAVQVVCSSTAEAAKQVAAAKQNWAAIAPLRAAEVYGLCCQAEGIQDIRQNETRFIMVGHRLAEMSNCDKTSLALVTADRPGALYQVLHEFAVREINLTHIQSRPSKQRLGEYIFFIDVDGYALSVPIQDVLAALQQQQVKVKLLGSYPKAP
ncbi:MAG: prephenate dehydratase [Peptococcaceae bacterium]|nr:prephenate dehydratase [Peptococcaceae bacterium]